MASGAGTGPGFPSVTRAERGTRAGLALQGSGNARCGGLDFIVTGFETLTPADCR